MEDFIRGLILSLTGPLRDVVNATVARLQAIYGAFVNVLARVRTSFGYWVNKGRVWALAQARHAVATANALRWLVTVEIPRRLSSLIDSIRAWTRERIAEALNAAHAALLDLRTWAAARIGDALTALTQVRDYVLRKISEILADLTRVRDTVTSLLGTPQRLATWLAGAMLDALVLIVVRDADRYADLFWRHRQNLEIRAIALAERILDRIM